MAETSSTNNNDGNNIINNNKNETAVSSNTTITPNDYNEDYIHTVTTQSYISRQANIIDATKYMEMKGRSIIYPNVQIRINPMQQNKTLNDDLVINGRIRIGRYCHIQSHTIIQLPLPSQKRYYGIDDIAIVDETKSNNNNSNIIVMTIGSHTMIGQYCNIQAIAIGSNCYIGDHVIIGPNVIIKDNCIIASYTQIPPNTIVPPFSRCCTNFNNNNLNNSISNSTNNDSNNNDSKNDNSNSLFIEWNDIRRRHIHFVMSTLPPSIALTLQERAVQAFDTFVIKYKEQQQQKQKQ